MANSLLRGRIFIIRRKFQMENTVKFSVFLKLLDARSISKVIREIDSMELAKALKHEEAATVAKLITGLPKRAAETLIINLEQSGNVTAEESKKCQEKILSVVRHLEEAGKIAV
jgi:flagellar motor switch protein FliG